MRRWLYNILKFGEKMGLTDFNLLGLATVPLAVQPYVTCNVVPGPVDKYVLTLAALPVTIALNGTSSAGGGIDILDFPKELDLFIAADFNLTVANGVSASWLASLGTSAADTSATLSGTEANIIQSTAATTTAGVGTAAAHAGQNSVLGAPFTTTFVIPVTLANLANSQELYVDPGFNGKIKAVNFRVGDLPASTAAKLATLTAQVAGTNVGTGGVIALTTSACSTAGAQVAGSAISGTGTTFTSAQGIGVAVSSVTAFSEGAGFIEITVVNTDLQSAAGATNGMVLIDGTTTSNSIYLNFALNADGTGGTTMTVSGTIALLRAP